MTTATGNQSAPQTPPTAASTSGVTPDARHLVLHNADLLHDIFVHLRVPPLPISRIPLPQFPVTDPSCISRSETRRVLGRAAIVCKAFSEPARDALWSSIDSVKPIFRALGMENNVATKFRKMPPGLPDIARRIREINHHPQSEESPIPSYTLKYFAGFVSNSHSHHLFRCLRVLRCTISMDYGPEMLKLAGPSLTHLALYDITEDMLPAINQPLIDLVYNSPLLEVLELRGDGISNGEFDMIGQLQSLTSVSITSQNHNIAAPTKIVETLAVLPSLQRLEIDVSDELPGTSAWRLRSLKVLRSVALRGKPLGLIAFLPSMRGTILNDLQVTIMQGHPTEHFHRIASQLSNELVLITQKSIRNLSIVDKAGILEELRPRPEQRDYVITIYSGLDRFARYLRQFTAPNRLNYESPAVFLDDEELKYIIQDERTRSQRRQKWNTLQTFSMPNPAGTISPRALRLHSIAPISRLHEVMEVFPDLEYIQLFFAITSSNIPDPDTFTPQRHFRLKVLSLGSPTTSQEFDNFVNDGTIFRLAGYINKLFPELKELRYDETSTVQTNLWRLVFGAIEFKRK